MSHCNGCFGYSEMIQIQSVPDLCKKKEVFSVIFFFKLGSSFLQKRGMQLKRYNEHNRVLLETCF